jgi:hypothetical protein
LISFFFLRPLHEVALSTPKMNTKRTTFRLICLSILVSIAIISCSKKEKCEGCDSDTPWSNLDASYCYPTKAACEAETELECEKCR